MNGRRIIPIVLMLLASGAPARAGWFNQSWSFRRPIDVTWDHEHVTGDEIAQAEFSTAGHCRPDGSDIRVATDEGKQVATRVLMLGPGDRARVVFSLAKGERKYQVYFGNPEPAPPPEVAREVPMRKGLLMEMHQLDGRNANNFDEITACWERSKTVIGGKMVEQPFIGFNPFGPQDYTITRYTGVLFAAADGEYMFVASADDRGALYIDGKPLVFAPNLAGDIRYNAKIKLSRGPHEFLFYHVNGGGDGRFTVAWKRPDASAVEVIPRDAFGIVYKGVVGQLEERGKTLTADFKVEYLGECFFNNHYTHRYKFTAAQPKASAAVAHEWDLGDGQTSTAKEFEHVYLTDGVYPVRLTMKIGNNSDAQTMTVNVQRDLERATQPNPPPPDDVAVHARIVKDYDVAKMPVGWLAWATWMHLKAKQTEPMVKVMQRMAAETNLPDPGIAVGALREGTRDAFMQGKGASTMAVWDSIPRDSNLQPRAVKRQAVFLIWWMADFAKAAKVLEPYVDKPDAQPESDDEASLERLYGEALVLNQQAEKGAKILRDLPGDGKPERRAVISGAMARSIEHYIDDGDWETGENVWDNWQTKYPSEFLEGYSVVLRTRLMEIRKANDAAAKVAEAFATAVPNSSYAPQLLDKASKLLASSDRGKSDALREMLKKRYPEDPLAQ